MIALPEGFSGPFQAWTNARGIEVLKRLIKVSDMLIENYSPRVMEKLGMRYEKDANYFGIDVTQYEISRDEFRPDDSVYVIESQEQT